MLTFFRRIRKSLLGGTSTSRYIIYAIGEIALVVVGILIALQINNWNEKRKGDLQCRVYLTNLKDELRGDSARLIQFDKINDEHASKGESLLQLLTHAIPISLDTSRLLHLLHDITFRPEFESQSMGRIENSLSRVPIRIR